MTLTSSPSKRALSARGKGFMFILAAISAVVVVLTVFLLLSRVVAQTQYYTLNKDIAARTQITSDDLTAVTTSVGTAPRSYTLDEVNSEPLFAKFSLKSGDVLTDSNVTNQLADLRAGLPNTYVVSSFEAQPSAAVSGKIQSGDYVDLYVVNTEDAQNPLSHLFLQHVLVLDAQIDLNNGAAADASSGDAATVSTDTQSGTGNSASNSASTRAGIPSLFTVGLSPENASRLMIAQQYKIYVALASKSAQDATKALPNSDVGASGDDVFSGSAPDAGAGTIADPNSVAQANGSAASNATPSASPAPTATSGAGVSSAPSASSTPAQ